MNKTSGSSGAVQI